MKAEGLFFRVVVSSKFSIGGYFSRWIRSEKCQKSVFLVNLFYRKKCSRTPTYNFTQKYAFMRTVRSVRQGAFNLILFKTIKMQLVLLLSWILCFVKSVVHLCWQIERNSIGIINALFSKRMILEANEYNWHRDPKYLFWHECFSLGLYHKKYNIFGHNRP